MFIELLRCARILEFNPIFRQWGGGHASLYTVGLRGSETVVAGTPFIQALLVVELEVLAELPTTTLLLAAGGTVVG